jgi:hypothetical protein
VELLTRIAVQGRPGADLDGAAELVAELGYLPLAVEQAAAYLRQNRLSPRGYLDLLAASPAVMYGQTARGADADAPSLGSGESPWTSSPTPRSPPRCCGSWPGMQPKPSPPPCSHPSPIPQTSTTLWGRWRPTT